MTPTPPTAEPLAIIGMGCLFPRASSFRAFWANICNRVDAITPVPATHWKPEDYVEKDPKAPDSVYIARGGFLEAVPFPAAEFGIAPNNLEATDTAQLLGLMVAKAALEDAGYEADRIDRKRVGCILGVTGTLELVIPLGARLGHPIWRRALADAGVPAETAEDVVRRIRENYVDWQENSFPGLLGNVVAGRIANRLDLGGTNCVVDAACASSLSAIHLAALELQTGRADLVLTGGVDTFNDIFMYMCFSKTPALSPTGDARPFDRDGDGTILGEGLGMVVLKRLSDARRDNDRVYAVLRGVGTSSDGRGNAIYAPKAAGQVEAVRSALRDSGVTPDTIELIEAHGTGTKVGDATEVQALTEVFGESGTRSSPWCAVGSIKSQIGHTKAAAGAAGLIKAAAALYHKVLPPTTKVRQPLEILTEPTSPFYVNTEKRPWMPSSAHPRRAGVSAFGFGGSNFHCILEEANARKTAIDWDANAELLAFAADSVDALKSKLASWPADLSPEELEIRAAASRRDWSPTAAHRLLVVLQRGRTEWSRQLPAAQALLARAGGTAALRSPDGIYYGAGEPDGKLAILFPGQGSQRLGMLRDFACAFPVFFDALCDADRSFRDRTDRRLSDYLYPVPVFDEAKRQEQEAALRDTRIAQPAIGAVSLGAWRVLESLSVHGDFFAGHSYGELTALCAAGWLTAADFFLLSVLRGRLMSDASSTNGGAMLAVQAPSASVLAILEEERLDLTVANRNAPNQTVLSGPDEMIGRAAAALTSRGIRHQRLAVGAAFHSPAVAAAVRPFADALVSAAWQCGAPAYANTTAAPYPADGGAARHLLANQIARPVDFIGEVERLYADGARSFLEVGPGSVLTGLVGQILHGRSFEARALDPSGGQRPGFFDLGCVVAWLAAQGRVVSLSDWGGAKKTPAPKPRSNLVIPICGANYVKPKAISPPTVTLAATNGVNTTTMNGHRSDNDRPSPSPIPRAVTDSATQLKAPAGSSSASLVQALHVTRDTLTALQRMQEQTAQLHRQFLEGQEAAQRTVHLLVEQQQRLLQTALGAAPSTLAVSPPVPLPSPLGAEGPGVRGATPLGLFPSPQPLCPKGRGAFGTDSNSELRTPNSEPPAPNSEADALLEVVAEKTGYPVEMLELDMALDADLGIDSIKRVEILGALQDRLPQAPAIKSEHLGSLQTLRQVAAFLRNGNSSAETHEPARLDQRHTPSPKSELPTPNSELPAAVLLAVVSEKTGYPVEMLELDMALDADLGIDSIKRVEIMSALQERLPQAPAIKSEHLGTLHTLRQVADFLANGHGELTPATHPAESAANTVERSVVRAVPLDPSRPPDRRLLRCSGEIVLTSDDSEVGPIVADRLRQLGFTPRLVRIAALATQEYPEPLVGLILLAPCRTLDAHLQHALLGLRRAAPALHRAAAQGGAVLLTASRLDGAFGFGRFPCQGDASCDGVAGALAGLAKTAHREWPNIGCKALDIAPDLPPNVVAEAVVEELLSAGPLEVAVSSGGRCALERVVTGQVPRGELPFRQGDVVVISGGARGVTAEVAVALAQACRPMLILLGRNAELRPEPDSLAALVSESDIKRELHHRANGSASVKRISEQFQQVMNDRAIRRNLERCAAAGARVVYRSVDVRDAGVTAAVLGEVRREFGPIRGLIHGAGVLADALIEDTSAEQFEKVWSTKVIGLRSLLSAVTLEDLRVLAPFSSSTARFGRAGQASYALANEALNKMAQAYAHRLPNCRVVSVNWGPWDGGMVTPGLKQLFVNEGVGLIPLAAGADFLLREISQTGERDVEVIALSPLAPRGRGVGGEGAECEKYHLSSPALLPSGAREEGLERRLPELPLAFERVVSVADHLILESHVLNGRPVVPFALLLEWLAHAAFHANPGLHFHGCDNLRVLHGVIVEESATLRAGAERATKHDGVVTAPVELRSSNPDGRSVLHARADIVLSPGVPTDAGMRNAANGHGSQRRTLPPVDEIYRSLLFHGPDLHAIEYVDDCDEQGITAFLRTAPAPAAWMNGALRQHWLADPLAIDGAFQLMILWSLEYEGAGCLPCFVSRYRQFRRSFPADGVHAALRVTRHNDKHLLANVDFLDGSEAIVARLEGCEATIDANLRPAFRRNRREAASTA